MRIRRMTALLAVAVALTAAAACGSDDSSSDETVATTAPAADTTAASADTTAAADPSAPAATEAPDATTAAAATTAVAGGDIELDRPLKITSIGYANEITLLWAVEKGLFEKHGVEVERVTIGGGSAAIAAVTTGAVDLGFTNGLSAIQAYSQGFPLKIVLGAYENAYPSDPITGRGVVANINSGVAQPCDLEGKKVGVTELGNIGFYYWKSWLTAKGCNIENVNFVAIPAGQIAAAVESGRVDAIETGGNAVQDLVNRGVAIKLGDPMAETSGPVEYAMYIANQDFIDENPNTLAAFTAAMNESVAQVNDPANLDESLAIAAKFANTTVELLKSSQREKLDTVVDIPVLQNMVQVLVDNGVLKEPLDITGLVHQP